MREIVDILQALKTAHVPTILIILGAFFLLLAFVEKVGPWIELAKERQKWAAITGGVLLLFGICLFLIPSPKPLLTAISPAQHEIRKEENEIRDKQDQIVLLRQTVDVLMGKVDRYEEQVTGPQSRIILYEHTDYKGHGCYVRPADHALDLRLYGCGNSVSSIKVEGNIRGRAHRGINYGPAPPLHIDHNMPFLNEDWNDRILSVIVEQRK